jgi:hypothetical protein
MAAAQNLCGLISGPYFYTMDIPVWAQLVAHACAVPELLALAALPGTALGRLGERSTASSAAWAAAGAAVRTLHCAPLPPWPGRRLDEIASELDRECAWLVTNGVLPTDLVTGNRRVAEAALRPWTPVFTHADVDLDVIRGWWSLRSLRGIRWLIEHGFDRPRQVVRSTY